MKLSSIHYIKELAKKTINSELKKLGTAQTKTAIEGVMHTVGLSSKEEAILFVRISTRRARDEAWTLKMYLTTLVVRHLTSWKWFLQ